MLQARTIPQHAVGLEEVLVARTCRKVLLHELLVTRQLYEMISHTGVDCGNRLGLLMMASRRNEFCKWIESMQP